MLLHHNNQEAEESKKPVPLYSRRQVNGSINTTRTSVFCIKSANTPLTKEPPFSNPENNTNMKTLQTYSTTATNSNQLMFTQTTNYNYIDASCNIPMDADFSDADSGISSPLSASYSDSVESNDELIASQFGIINERSSPQISDRNQNTADDVMSVHNYANHPPQDKALPEDSFQTSDEANSVQVRCIRITSLGVNGSNPQVCGYMA